MKTKDGNSPADLTEYCLSRKYRFGKLALGVVVLLVTSCGGTGTGNAGANTPISPQPSANQGSVFVFGGDAPLCDVISLSVTITGMTLTPSNGGAVVTVFSSDKPVTVDFASLMGTSMMLGSASVPPGSYSQATVTLMNPQLGLLNPVTTGMGYGMMNTTLAASSVTLNLNPPLEVQTNASVGMMLDMSLLKSVETGTSGTVTGTINPSLQGSALTNSADNTMVQSLGMLSGIIGSVSIPSSNSSFTGSFTLRQSMMGHTFTVNVDSQTSFEGISGLSALTQGDFVQLEARVDSEGNLVASEVDAEGQTNSQQSTGAFVGMITSASPYASGSNVQFQMGMNQEFPDMRSMMTLFSQPEVTVPAGASFQIAEQAANFAHLSFDSGAMGRGQALAVLGQITGASGGMMGGSRTASLTANSVILQPQPLIGTFTRVLAAGDDGKSGGFAMVPCSSAFGNGTASVPVLTSPQTSFGNLSGLSGMISNSRIVVHGLLFYEPSMTEVNGVPLTPPGWIFEATQVRLAQ